DGRDVLFPYVAKCLPVVIADGEVGRPCKRDQNRGTADEFSRARASPHTRSNGDRRAPGLAEIVGVVDRIATPCDEPMAHGNQAVRMNRAIVNPNWRIHYGG